MSDIDESDFRIPRNLEAPKMLLIWSLDSSMLFIVTLILFGMLNLFVVGFFAAYSLTRSYSYLKEEGGKGLIVKVLYWYTPSGLWFSKKHTSSIREFLGG